MRINIIAAIFICFCSNLGFSQSRTLLHTFERHLVDQPSAMNGVMNFYGKKKEDYTMRLYSDSTFSINYYYSATGNFYRNYKTSEIAIGSFFNKGELFIWLEII
jgi:hypothetical protein